MITAKQRRTVAVLAALGWDTKKIAAFVDLSSTMVASFIRTRARRRLVKRVPYGSMTDAILAALEASEKPVSVEGITRHMKASGVPVNLPSIRSKICLMYKQQLISCPKRGYYTCQKGETYHD